jgi:hypothetical protein
MLNGIGIHNRADGPHWINRRKTRKGALNPVAVYVAMAVALVFCIGATIVYMPPTRPCHQCGRRLAITARTCRHCGYRFTK